MSVMPYLAIICMQDGIGSERCILAGGITYVPGKLSQSSRGIPCFL